MNKTCTDGHRLVRDKRGNKYCRVCGHGSAYPPEWLAGKIQRYIRMRAGHRCEWCRMPFHRGTNMAMFDKCENGSPVVGTVHHINEIKSDCSFNNLVYLCQRCHMRVQWRWRPGGVLPVNWLDDEGNPPGWIVKRNLSYRVVAWQRSLFK